MPFLNILGSRGRVNDVLYYLWYWADTALGWIGLGWVLGDRFAPVKFLGAELGVVIGLVSVALPFAILPIYSSLERMDKSFLEASMDLGASQFRTFFLILIPLTTAGLANRSDPDVYPNHWQFPDARSVGPRSGRYDRKT